MNEDAELKTDQQRKALFLWMKWLAEDLSSAGIDLPAILEKKSIAVPVNQTMCVEVILRPVIKALTGQDSTKKLTKEQINEIVLVIQRHFANQHEVVVSEFPSEFSMYAEDGAERLQGAV